MEALITIIARVDEKAVNGHEIQKHLRRRTRGEREITNFNREYLLRCELTCGIMQCDTVRLYTGTFNSLSEATEHVRVIELKSRLY